MVYKSKLEATQCRRTNFISYPNNFYQFLILQIKINTISLHFIPVLGSQFLVQFHFTKYMNHLNTQKARIVNIGRQSTYSSQPILGAIYIQTFTHAMLKFLSITGKKVSSSILVGKGTYRITTGDIIFTIKHLKG